VLKFLENRTMEIENTSRPDGDFPVWDIDPYDENILREPRDYFEALRELGPVVWIEKYGFWAIGRYQQVRSVFGDWKRFCSSRGVGVSDFKTEKPWRPPSIILEVDPPDHNRTRNALARAMSPKRVHALRPTMEKEADALVDRILDKGSIEVVSDLAEAFPLKIFPDAVGIDDADRHKLITYGAMVFNALGPDNRVRRQTLANAVEIVPWIIERCKRENLTGDGFGAAIYKAADDGKLTGDEAALLVRSLLSAGVDTTVTGIGNALLSFAHHPDQWALLREDPSLARQAFEEVLRYESPIHSFFRTTSEDVELDGVKLGEGRKISVGLHSANLDPRHWQDPDTFDIMRKPTGHMALGVGVHGCVGQMIARLELEVLLTALARKVKTIEPDGDHVWRAGNSLRGLDHLPVQLRAA
jgi:4-methoxybenzoate monooxygenase (O-demethylating)